MVLRIVFLCAYLGVGVLFAVLAVPPMRRKVPPNAMYGFRTRKTLNDPAVWYDANEFSGRCLFRLGIVVGLSSLVLFFIPAIHDIEYSIACQVIMITGIAASVIMSYRYVNDITKEESDDQIA
jgi:uncharacterized membrane protein